MTVQHITWMFLHDDIDCIEKAIEVTFHDKWCSNVRHDEITDEHHAQFGQVNEHGIMRLSAMDRNQLDAGSANFQLGLAIDGCVGLETTYAIGVVAFPKEGFGNRLRSVEFTGYFLEIVAPGVETRFWCQAAEISLSADGVPVRVGNEDGGQRRQIRGVGVQCLVGGFCRVSARSRVDPDQLLPVVRDHEIVFGEFETGEHINPSGYNFGYAARRKRVT